MFNQPTDYFIPSSLRMEVTVLALYFGMIQVLVLFDLTWMKPKCCHTLICAVPDGGDLLAPRLLLVPLLKRIRSSKLYFCPFRTEIVRQVAASAMAYLSGWTEVSTYGRVLHYPRAE